MTTTCTRCKFTFIPVMRESLCPDCLRWLEQQQEIAEQPVATIAQVVSRVVHGEREQPERSWWCW